MRRVIAIAALLMTATSVAGNESLSMRVTPQLCVEPAVVVVRVTVEPHDENGALEIVAESAEFLRSSRIQLDGSHAARTSVFQYRDLPAGTYEVRSVLVGRDGHRRAVAQRTVRVLR